MNTAQRLIEIGEERDVLEKEGKGNLEGKEKGGGVEKGKRR